MDEIDCGSGAAGRVEPNLNGERQNNGYEVGYGRPPKHGQFKPGQSGNPKGRRKAARGLKTLLREELGEKVRVTENGTSKSLSKLQLIVKRLVERASKGEPRAIAKLVELNITLFGIEDDENREAALTREQEAILHNLSRRRSGGDAEADPIAGSETDGDAHTSRGESDDGDA